MSKPCRRRAFLRYAIAVLVCSVCAIAIRVLSAHFHAVAIPRLTVRHHALAMFRFALPSRCETSPVHAIAKQQFSPLCPRTAAYIVSLPWRFGSLRRSSVAVLLDVELYNSFAERIPSVPCRAIAPRHKAGPISSVAYFSVTSFHVNRPAPELCH